MISMKKTLLTLLTILSGLPIWSQSIISYLEGDVTVTRNSRKMDGDFGMDLEQGDVVRTGSRALAILELEHGRTLKLRENSTVVLDNLSKRTSVELETGSVFAKVDRLLGGSFNVQSEGVVAGVRGTQFFMAYGEKIDDKADLWLCVNEGRVEVSIPEMGESVLVNEGEGIIIPGSSKLTDPEAYDWTKDLNWSTDPDSGDVRDETDLSGAYSDLLDQDYF